MTKLATIGFWVAFFLDIGMIRWCVQNDPYNISRPIPAFSMIVFWSWMVASHWLYIAYLCLRGEQWGGWHRLAATFSAFRLVPLGLWSGMVLLIGVLP